MFGRGAGPGSPAVDPRLVVDDSLSELAKAERYMASSLPVQRLVYTRSLVDCARAASADTALRRLHLAMQAASRDAQAVVRVALARALGQVAALPAETRPSRPVVEELVLPLLDAMLADGSAEVRAAAAEAVLQVAARMPPDEVGATVLARVLQLAHDEDAELRATAVPLLAELAADRLDRVLVHNFVVHEMCSFAHDPAFKVRRAAATCLPSVCRAAGAEVAAERLVPAFVRLSADRIWGVRKGCAESLVAVARHVPAGTRAGELFAVWTRLTADPSRWVRFTALAVSGRLVHAFGADAPPQLIAQYAGLPELPPADLDADVLYHCAYSLPAVALALGPARFAAELAPVFARLWRGNRKFAVRRTLAHSLHELGRIVGPAASEQFLLPAYDRFLMDVDEVRAAAVARMADFLACLPQERRDRLATVPRSACPSAIARWRARRSVASQLCALCACFSPPLVAEHLVPLALMLLGDGVEAVRVEAARQAAPAYAAALSGGDDGGACAQLAAFVDGLPRDPSYQRRQLYVHLCEGAAASEACAPVFEATLLGPLLALAADPVPNVRMLVAAALGSDGFAPRRARDDVTAALVALAEDADRDVARAGRLARAAPAAEAGAGAEAGAAEAGAEAEAEAPALDEDSAMEEAFAAELDEAPDAPMAGQEEAGEAEAEEAEAEAQPEAEPEAEAEAEEPSPEPSPSPDPAPEAKEEEEEEEEPVVSRPRAGTGLPDLPLPDDVTQRSLEALGDVDAASPREETAAGGVEYFMAATSPRLGPSAAPRQRRLSDAAEDELCALPSAEALDLAEDSASPSPPSSGASTPGPASE